jgi:hypothetical protein
MAQEINARLVIKVFLVVVSAILGAFFLFRLYYYFVVSDSKPFSDTNSATLFVSLAAGLVLSALAFWGAFAENHILCYISLGAAICLTLWFILQILRCLFGVPKLFDKESMSYHLSDGLVLGYH